MEIRQRLNAHLGQTPQIDPTAIVIAGAVVIGHVLLGPGASVFYGAVLRGDINAIEIGAGSNIQDNAVIHVSNERPAWVGEEVSIGHLACVHACRIEAGALIGMQATVLDGATVGAEALVAAGALIPAGMEVPEGMLAVGVPARIVRSLTAEERRQQRELAAKYQEVARAHAARVSSAG